MERSTKRRPNFERCFPETRTRGFATRPAAFCLASDNMSWRGNFCKARRQKVPGANLDLAIARFFTEGPVSALAALEQTPDGDQVRRLLAAESKPAGFGRAGG